MAKQNNMTMCSIPPVAVLMWATVAYSGEIEGRPKAVNGDSFNIEVRIFGIDTPESRQTCKNSEGRDYPCGAIASEAMKALIKGKTVNCEKRDQDKKNGRPVAVCYVDGKDIGAIMVERGLAVAYRKYSDKYVEHEERAKAEKRGLWAGTFEMPWDYRARTHRVTTSMLAAASPVACPSSPPDPISSGCEIKGNISNKRGNPRLYHLPGSPSYGDVVITPSKGERFFCSEEEAIACGWRKAGGP